MSKLRKIGVDSPKRHRVRDPLLDVVMDMVEAIEFRDVIALWSGRKHLRRQPAVPIGES